MAGPVVVYGFVAAWVFLGLHYGLWGFAVGWAPAGIIAYLAGRIVDAMWPISIALAAVTGLWTVVACGSLLFGW